MQTTPSKQACDADQAARLWAITEAQLAKAELAPASPTKVQGLPNEAEADAVAAAAPKAGGSTCK